MVNHIELFCLNADLRKYSINTVDKNWTTTINIQFLLIV